MGMEDANRFVTTFQGNSLVDVIGAFDLRPVIQADVKTLMNACPVTVSALNSASTLQAPIFADAVLDSFWIQMAELAQIMMSVCRATMDVSTCATIFMEAIPVHVILGFPSTETTGLVQM